MVRAELPERDFRGRLRSVVQADRDRDHPERNDSLPHRSRHGDEVYLPLPGLATNGCFLIGVNAQAPTSRRSMTSIDAPNPTTMIASMMASPLRSRPLDSGMPKSLNADRSCTQSGHLKIGPTSASR